jgi:hypothetical protein
LPGKLGYDLIGRQPFFLSKLHQTYPEYQIFGARFMKKISAKMLIPLDSGDTGKTEGKSSSLFVDNHRISPIFE